MTNLEALKSLTEYRSDSDNIFTKALLDNELTGGDTYVATNEKTVDLTMADIYLSLAGHPEMRDGRWGVKYSREDCMILRRAIYDKWGLVLPEISSQSNVPQVTGVTEPSRNALW